MILKIESRNPRLLDVLHKNPNTDYGLYLNPLKNGVIVGNAVDAHHYDIVFQDTRHSYLPEDSNAIDFQSYSSPLVVLDITSELFSNLTKDQNVYWSNDIKWLNKTNAEVDIFACKITIPTFYVSSGWMQNGQFLLNKYFDGIKFTHKVGFNYSLEVKGESVFEVINLLNLTAVFCHITNRYGVWTYIDDFFAKKYGRILTNISNVPYFVFYLFIKRVVKSPKQFENLRPRFEAYLKRQGLETKLTSLPTHQARVDFILNRLDYSLPILDVGCGEFIYFHKIMKKPYFENYYAIDEDPKFDILANNIKKDVDTNSLIFSTNFSDIPTDKIYNIILTEVIEHNEIEEAKQLVKKVLEYNMKSCVITTPNVEFNKYYSDDIESRHDDHDFELTRDEFKSFIEECLLQFSHLKVAYDYIGDEINGVQPTQVAIIEPKYLDNE